MLAQTNPAVNTSTKSLWIVVLVWVLVLKRVLTVLFRRVYTKRNNKAEANIHIHIYPSKVSKFPNTLANVHSHAHKFKYNNMKIPSQICKHIFYYLNSMFKCNILKYLKHFVNISNKKIGYQGDNWANFRFTPTHNTIAMPVHTFVCDPFMPDSYIQQNRYGFPFLTPRLHTSDLCWQIVKILAFIYRCVYLLTYIFFFVIVISILRKWVYSRPKRISSIMLLLLYNRITRACIVEGSWSQLVPFLSVQIFISNKT